MKSMIDLLLIWWLRTGRYSWSRLRRRLFERKYLSQPLPTVASLKDIESRLREVKWTMDGPWHLFDSISYPEATWAKKKDDCDGFATLASALLKQLNNEHSPSLLTVLVRPIRLSHTVCALKAPCEGLWLFDNYTLRRVNCQNYSEIAALISQKAERLICWDVRNPDTFDMIEFHQI